MTTITQRFVTAIAGILAALLVQKLSIDQHTADIISTALASGAIGWATKHFSDWGNRSGGLSNLITPGGIRMFFSYPKLYFVSKASTVELTPQPSIPFDVISGRTLALSQVSPAYTEANFNQTWTLVVAANEKDAARVGAVNLQP